MLNFTKETESAEEKLFYKTRELMVEVERKCSMSKDIVTLTIRCLKTRIMTNPYDIRGSRRLAVICTFIQVSQVKGWAGACYSSVCLVAS